MIRYGCTSYANRGSCDQSLPAAIILLSTLQLVVPRALAQDIDDATLARAKKATVMVWTLASKNRKADMVMGTGTGYFINSTGMLITNNHVIDPAHGMSPLERQKFQYKTNRLTFIVIQNSGTADEKHWECDLLHQSVTADQALLQARTKDGGLLATPEYLDLLPAWRLREDMTVCAIGFPGGNRLAERGRNARASTSTGNITKVPRSASGRVRRIETDAVARPGNSGGPMVDRDGFVVGTVTLMSQREDQANTCALVPVSLTRSFLRDAMADGRLPMDTDFVPFLDVLAHSNESLEIPTLHRLADRDTIFLRNGERVYGDFSDKVIHWRSSLGNVSIPVGIVAYILRYGDQLHLILENGDHIRATDPSGRFQFAAEGGTILNKTYRAVTSIAFRTHSVKSRKIRDDAYVLSSDSGRLVLGKIEGKTTLKSRSGTIKLSFSDIACIDRNSSGRRQVVSLKDDRVITGRLGNEKFHAQMAALDQSIELELSRVTQAAIERVDASAFGSEGVTLVDIMRSADQSIVEVAKALHSDDVPRATSILAPYLDAQRMKRMPDGLKAQVRLLEGMIALRNADPGAAKKIRKCVRASDPCVAAYARGSVEVLRRYGNEFDGEPISDPEAFSKAGLSLGRELIADARALLNDREHLEGKRGEYTRYMNRIKKSEKAMQAAAVFAGPEADDVLMNLWKMALDLCRLESKRLITEHKFLRAGRVRVSRTEWQKLHAISKKHDKVVVEWTDRYSKLREFGFYHAAEPDQRKLDEN